MRFYGLLFLSLPGLFACEQSCQNTKSKEIPPAGLAGTASGQDRPPGGEARTVIQGKVLEAIHQSSFSYLRIQTKSGSEEWVALLKNNSKVGEEVTIEEQVVIPDFESKSLGRTFARMTFGSVVQPN